MSVLIFYAQLASLVFHKKKFYFHFVSIINFLFRDLGWGHWVISPSKMRINSCKGACDLGVVAPEHLYNDIMQKSNKNFRPCCTPRKMSPVNIYYRESEGSFKIKSLENMTVEQCGCGSRP